ncbi:MAG: 3-phosphoglycerate dehydrogenase [Chloroflexi bacterium]|nr:3-phosphoglycerate dehydrogenase [Chloroflexota bacterium]|tara:strand:+ start:12553 stop:13494 length:942 start_codon:yes stop_codon:yes gene_type:complete
MSKIVIVDDDPQVVTYDSSLFNDLKDNNEIEVFKSLPKDSREIISRLNNAHTAVITKATTKINNNILENLPQLRHIAVFGIALDHIDVDSAKRNNIEITNIPDVLTNSVAEHSIGLMISLIKKIPELDRRVRNNEWPSIDVDLFEGKTLGIIGAGAIGEKVARIGYNLGMKIIISPVLRLDKVRNLSFQEIAKVSDLNYLVSNSDVISLHTRIVQETEYLIDTDQFAIMKSNAILVNTARGKLVNEKALYDSLISGKIAGAALDVFEKEPLSLNNRLKSLSNVILTPHNAANSHEVKNESIKKLINNIKSKLD